MNENLKEMCFFKAKDINGNWLTGTVAYLPKAKDSENYGYYISGDGSEPYATKIRKETICRPLLIVDSKKKRALFENDMVKINFNEQESESGMLIIKNAMLYFRTYKGKQIYDMQIFESAFSGNVLRNSEFLCNKSDIEMCVVYRDGNINDSGENNTIS